MDMESAIRQGGFLFGLDSPGGEIGHCFYACGYHDEEGIKIQTTDLDPLISAYLLTYGEFFHGAFCFPTERTVSLSFVSKLQFVVLLVLLLELRSHGAQAEQVQRAQHTDKEEPIRLTNEPDKQRHMMVHHLVCLFRLSCDYGPKDYG